MTAKFSWMRRRLLPGIVLAMAAPFSAKAQSNADRQQEVEVAFDHYSEAKTDSQRAAILDYLQHLNRQMVSEALVDHIVSSRNGVQATSFNQLVENLSPEGCAAVLNRLGKAADPVEKGKLIVALRHCKDAGAVTALAACLGDTRAVAFESHGPMPRRVCDLAYDELFLKLRNDPQYGLDPSHHMKGIITEKMPLKSRDLLIATLKARLSAKPAPAPASPAPSPTPIA